MERHALKELEAMAEMAHDDGDHARGEMLGEEAHAARKTLQHIPEPWRECGADTGGCQCCQIWSKSADCIVAVALTHKDESYTGGDGPTQEAALANAKRIVACVNALEGIEDPSTILADMLHCQERVVNLLEALRFIMGQRPGSARDTKEGLRERLRNVFASAQLAIALEEKEGQS